MAEDDPIIRFHLDASHGVSPYRQLVEQVRLAVASGLLRTGDRLPSVRDVVTQITINPNTVHRAYRELEYQGVAEGRPGLGTFIRAGASSEARGASETSLIEELTSWVATARAQGLSERQIADLAETVLPRPGRTRS